MMLLNGKVIYACTARLGPREKRLDLLPSSPHPTKDWTDHDPWHPSSRHLRA
jgi:hypothetical protein